jgi:hypothetical protein
MRFNTPIVKCKAIAPPPVIFLALSLIAACFVNVPRLRADQSQQETISLLTTGQWTLRGVIRTFNQDGTYTSSSATKGTWKIKGSALEITLGRMVLRFNLPLDPNGTPGVSQGGKEQTLARVSANDNPTEHERGSRARSGTTTESVNAQQSAARFVQTYHDSLVFVTGTEGAGSGFVAAMGNGNFLVTNVHVVAGIPDATFKKLDGATVRGGAPSMAVGEDIFYMALPAGGTPLPIMRGVDSNAAIGDEVAVLGNAEGQGVINTIIGRIVGIGPNLVEVDAPFVPGNSGSPIIHLKTGKVIGVATYYVTNEYDVTTKRKLIRPVIRRFGYRLDGVNKWQPVDWGAFWQQRDQMESIEKLTADLYDFYVDLDDNKGAITPGRHTNPIFKNRINDWIEASRGRATPADRLAANANLLSFLKTACESDIAIAQREITYDYFQRELADQKQYRDAMAKGFEEMLNDLRY